ncbi:MAG: DUF6279 family lipoprotein [Rhodocyclaceae bacterium]
MTRTLLTLLGCLLVTGLMAGCGVRLAYNQIDRLVPWYVSDYVTLDRAQRRLLDERLSEHVAWHCATQLPAYTATLARARADLDAGGDPIDVATTLIDEAEAHWQALLDAITPDLVALLASLEPAQIDQLREAFETSNEALRSDLLAPTESSRVRARSDRLEKRLRRWIGPLDAPQRARVRDWATRTDTNTAAWIAQREAWQTALLDVLTQPRSDPEHFRSQLTGLIRSPEQVRTPAQREALQRNREATLGLLGELLDSASPRQRQRLDQALADLGRDFDQLACAAPGQLGQASPAPDAT